MRITKNISIWYNKIRESGWISINDFCNYWGFPSTVRNWMTGCIRTPNINHNSETVNKICQILECTKNDIYDMCEDAYRIKNKKRPNHELSPIGNKELTINRINNSEQTSSDFNTNSEIPLEDWLARAYEYHQEQDEIVSLEKGFESTGNNNDDVNVIIKKISKSIYGKVDYDSYNEICDILSRRLI